MRKLIRRSKYELKEKLDVLVIYRDCLYSLVNVKELPEISIEYDGTTYKVKVVWVQQITPQDRDMLIFYKIFLNKLMERAELKRIGIGKHFDASKSRPLKGCEVWPGYSTALSTFESGVLFNVNPTNKFIMEQTALDLMRNTRSKTGNTKELVAAELVGRGVMTRYNQRIYRVEDIDYEMNPMKTFTLNEKGQTREITYKDYYKEKYGFDIKDLAQPMLVHVQERRGEESKIYLVPETCMLTGISDDLKAKNSRDMRDILFANAEQKYKRIQTFFTTLMNHEKCKALMQEWKMTLNDTPLHLEGAILDPGVLLIGNKQKIDLRRDANDFDRKITSLFSQPRLEKWCVFYPKRFKREADSLMKEIQNVVRDFKYPCKPPRRVEIENEFPETWKAAIDKTLGGNPDTGCAIFIIQGKKGASPVYHEMKKKLISEVPVPSQMILAETLSRGKGIRSIANKLFIQCNAKFGGAPWGFENLPMCEVPTMICGVEVFRKMKDRNKSILGWCASIDRFCSRFHSIAKVQGKDDTDVGKSLGQACLESIKKFKEVNKIAPKRIVIYR